jgi:O-glycosyl hydrolase
MHKGWMFLCLQLAVALTLEAQDRPVTFTIRSDKPQQTIDNFGGSGCWFSEGIGRYWPESSRDSIATLLFSQEMNSGNRPQGIALSAWRFNIGGGTAEQGEQSGIKTPVKRIECFLTGDGSYNWTKQSGYQWFLHKAKEFKVENLIAFSNTPPVYFTKNKLGFKTEKDYVCNLREDKYEAYAAFLATVLRHFDSCGLHFKYVSPVNEPQWDWSNKFGLMNQEGTPWSNNDIYHIVRTLDSTISGDKLTTRILLPEAATLKHLYGEQGLAGKQIQAFYGASATGLRNFPNVHPVVAGHSYFTDAGDTSRIIIRKHLSDTLNKYKVSFWQSEYSMLGNGYKENRPGRIPAMDCALFLAKIIHTDLTVANATAWQLWNVFEPGSADFDTRYYLIALQTNDSNTRGTFRTTKNLWAMGHFSRFIRPGMKRVSVERDDNLSDELSAQDMMVSAYKDADGRSVIVVINYSHEPKTVHVNLENKRTGILYSTTAVVGEDMSPKVLKSLHGLQIKPRSINTIVTDK